jgi:PST family polysaccharide transporter
MALSEGGVGELDPTAGLLANPPKQKAELLRILSNTIWLAGDRIIRLGVGLFVSSWVARYLGPERFGALNYAIAFVYLFSILGCLGMDSIVVRGFIQEPEKKDTYLCTAFMVKLTGATLSFILSLATLYWMKSDRATILLIAVIGLGSIVQATDAIDFWFQSQVKSKWTVLSKNTAFFIVTLFKVALLVRHAGLIWFGVSALLEIVIGAVGMVFYLYRLGDGPRSFTPDFRLAVRILSQCWPLFLSGVSVMVYMRIDQIMLEQMAGQSAVGLYSAAVRVSEMFYFVPMVVGSSVFPAIVASRDLGQAIYLGRIQKYFNLSALLALSIALPMSFASGLITHILYGSQYAGVATILTAHIWASMFVFMGVARGQYLLSEGLFKFTMVATASGAICNIILNLVWIPPYAAFGSALATVVSYGVSDLLSSFCYRRTWKIGLMQLKALCFPLTIARMIRDRDILGRKA